MHRRGLDTQVCNILSPTIELSLCCEHLSSVPLAYLYFRNSLLGLILVFVLFLAVMSRAYLDSDATLGFGFSAVEPASAERLPLGEQNSDKHSIHTAYISVRRHG